MKGLPVQLLNCRVAHLLSLGSSLTLAAGLGVVAGSDLNDANNGIVVGARGS